MALDIRGKTALVTGGAHGICFDVARLLLAGGCNVTVADIKPSEPLDRLVRATDGKETRVVFIQTDVTIWPELQESFSHAIKEFGRLDIVVPGAGIFEPLGVSSFWCLNQGLDTVEASSFKTLDVNVNHPIRATQLAIDTFLRQKTGHGVVVLVSSIAAQAPSLTFPLYAASKSAISGFIRALAPLERKLNIRVNGVAPGLVKTSIWTGDKLSWITDGVDEWVSSEKVARVILDLITNGDHVGGTILEVGVSTVRPVTLLNDAGPTSPGCVVHNLASGFGKVYDLIDQNFGK